MPLVASRDTPGMMARSVEDIILMNSVLSMCNTTIPSVNLTGLRVGFATNWWTQIADEVCPSFKIPEILSKGALINACGTQLQH